MFWESGFCVSTIDELLKDSENCTIEALLNDETIIQECRAQNFKLIDMLSKTENVRSLIDYVVTVPKDETDKINQFNYANVSCEVFLSDVEVFNAAIVEEENFYRLWKLFNYDYEEINAINMGFLYKIFNLIFMRKPQIILQYFEKDESIMDNLVRNIHLNSACNIILRLLSPTDDDNSVKDAINFLLKYNLIDKLLDLFPKSHEYYVGCVYILSEILHSHRSSLGHDFMDFIPTADLSSLYKNLVSDEFINKLINLSINSTSNNSSPYYYALCCVYDVQRSSELYGEIANFSNPLATIAAELRPTINIFIDHIDSFKAQLTNAIQRKKLGQNNYYLAKLLCTLILYNNSLFNQEIIDKFVIKLLLDLVFCFSLNTMLHSVVFTMLERVICNKFWHSSDSTDESFHNLLHHIFNNLSIFSVLSITEPINRLKISYNGFILNLADTIECLMNDQSKENAVIHKFISEHYSNLSHESKEKWEFFKKNFLQSFIHIKHTISVPEISNSISISDFNFSSNFTGSSMSMIDAEKLLKSFRENSENPLKELDEIDVKMDMLKSPLKNDSKIDNYDVFSIECPNDPNVDCFTQISTFENMCRERIQPYSDVSVDIMNNDNDDNDDDDDKWLTASSKQTKDASECSTQKRLRAVATSGEIDCSSLPQDSNSMIDD